MVQEVIIQDRRIDIDLYIDVVRADIVIGAQQVTVQSAPSISIPISVEWEDVSGNVTVVSGAYYEVDTRTSVATLYLPGPLTVLDNARVFVRDKFATFGLFNCRMVPAAGSGHTIAGLAVEETLEMDYSPNGGFFLFMFDADTLTWSW